MPEEKKETARAQAGLPPSKPLQIFLLFAFLVTGAAYVVDQWTDVTHQEMAVQQPNRFRRMLAGKNQFETESALGREASAKKLYVEAATHYRRAMAVEITPQGLVQLGNALLKTGSPDMAYSQFKQALRMDRDDEEIYLAWGAALIGEGKWDEAEQIDQDALRRNSRFAGIHYQYATVLEHKRRTALEQTAAALRGSTNDTHFASQASLYARDAARHFTAAERLGLTSPDFLADYGALLNREGKYAEAETNLTKALLLQTNAAIQLELGRAEFHQGKLAGAIAHFEAALSARSDDAETLDGLALIYATATNSAVRSAKMAVQLATRACDATKNENPHYLDTLARAYAADGDFFQAIAWEDKAVRRATELNDRKSLNELEPRFNLFVQHKLE